MTVQEKASQLDAAFPGWIVWWGEYSRAFWAIPVDWPGGPHLRAVDPDVLVRQIRAEDARRLPRPPLGAPVAPPALTAAALAPAGARL